MIQVGQRRPSRLPRLADLIDALDETSAVVPRLELMIDGIRDLLDADVGGFNYVDLADRRHSVLLRPAVIPDASARGQRVIDTHPIIVRYRTYPQDRDPKRLSDHVYGRWMDHEAYKELFEPMGTPHMIAIPLPWKERNPSCGSAYAVTRAGSDFQDDHLRFASVIQIAARLLHTGEPVLTATGRLELLTESEREIIELIARGITTPVIAVRRNVSVATVRKQRSNAYAKLNLHDRPSIARLLGYRGVIPRPADRIREIYDS
jgi:DNA-binding CsgD family transcriptional regulator